MFRSFLSFATSVLLPFAWIFSTCLFFLLFWLKICAKGSIYFACGFGARNRQVVSRTWKYFKCASSGRNNIVTVSDDAMSVACNRLHRHEHRACEENFRRSEARQWVLHENTYTWASVDMSSKENLVAQLAKQSKRSSPHESKWLRITREVVHKLRHAWLGSGGESGRGVNRRKLSSVTQSRTAKIRWK